MLKLLALLQRNFNWLVIIGNTVAGDLSHRCTPAIFQDFGRLWAVADVTEKYDLSATGTCCECTYYLSVADVALLFLQE